MPLITRRPEASSLLLELVSDAYITGIGTNKQALTRTILEPGRS